MILSQLFHTSTSTFSETICVLFSRCHRQLEQCHSPCLMTGITEPCICILHSLQDSTASHFMVCNLHFALRVFPPPLLFFSSCLVEEGGHPGHPEMAEQTCGCIALVVVSSSPQQLWSSVSSFGRGVRCSRIEISHV